MDIKYLDIKSIRPYEKNPRKNDVSVDKVAESIKQFGFKVPLVLDKDNIVVCGHTRLKAAKKLGIDKIPCIIADDLSEEQIKAYRLADNRVGEESEWDISLLNEELDGILDIDMSELGFDLTIADDYTQEDSSYFGDERERTFDAYNLYDADIERSTKKWQMPIIKRCDYVPKDLISFNYAKTSKEYDKGIHFYIDDYQFERIWNDPHTYMDILKEFDCVLTPDFSLYQEMPLPMQIWNVYRSKLIGQIMQDYGMRVIPTLQWCGENSFDFAFDGIEPGGTVSVSTIGVKTDKDSQDMWVNGMNEAIRQLDPKTIVVYGGDIGYDFGSREVIYINNHNAERLKHED